VFECLSVSKCMFLETRNARETIRYERVKRQDGNMCVSRGRAWDIPKTGVDDWSMLLV
jgi:hypothetical protein